MADENRDGPRRPSGRTLRGGGRAPAALLGIAGRAFMLFFATLWLGGIGSAFYWLGGEFLRELRKAYAFRPVPATITEATPDARDEFGEETAGRLAYRYGVDGQTYEGRGALPAADVTPVPGEDAGEAGPPGPLRTGDTITVYYDPDDPARSTLRPEVQPFFIGFFIFLSPFAAVGLVLAYTALFARTEALTEGMRGREAPKFLGGALLAAYFGVSAVAAFGFFGLAMVLEWRTALWVGLALWWGVVPLATVGIVLGYRAVRGVRPGAAGSGGLAAAVDLSGPAGGAAAREGRSARSSAPGDGPEAEGVSSAKGLLFFVPFTLFWCGITGVFVVIIVGSIARHLDAQRRFLPAEGTVIASKVSVHDDSDGDTYAPRIKYRYAVGGTEYTGDRYAFGQWSTGEREHWEAVVEAHPPGAGVTVYYDPEDPSEAVLHLDVPPMQWGMLLFIQPFVVIGVGLTWACVHLAWNRRRLRGFLAAPAAPPWDVPTWGTLRPEMDGLVLAPRATVQGAALGFGAAYGGACFLLIFVVLFGFGGPEKRPGIIAPTFGVAVAAGLAGAVAAVRAVGRKAVLRLETGAAGGALWLTGPKRDVRVRLADVAAWTVRHVRNVHRGEDGPRTAPLVAALTRAGEEVPVHVFAAGEEGMRLARRTAEGLADLTGRPFRPDAGKAEGPVGTEAADAPMSAGEVLRAARQAARRAKAAADRYADLT